MLRPHAQAYCLYRRSKLPEALAALKEVPADKEVARLQLEAQVGRMRRSICSTAQPASTRLQPIAFAHEPQMPAASPIACTAPNSLPTSLAPQIHYRLGDNKEAIALYSELFRSHSAESREVQTNVVAAYVAGGRAGEVPAVMQAMKVGRGAGGRVAGWVMCGGSYMDGDASKRGVVVQEGWQERRLFGHGCAPC